MMVGSFNFETLFGPDKALNPPTWAEGAPAAQAEPAQGFESGRYTAADKALILELLGGTPRRHKNSSPVRPHWGEAGP